MKKVSIVVLNYRTYIETIACLDSLFKVTYPNIEIIVVDNASGNDSLGQISDAMDSRGLIYSRVDTSNIDVAVRCQNRLLLFQAPSNRGYSAGNNWGITIALRRGADYVMLLNNDTLVSSGFLEPLVEFADRDEKIGAVGPKIIGPDGNIDHNCARGRMGFWGWWRVMTYIRRCYMDIVAVNMARGYYYKDYQYDKPKEVDTLSGACMLLSRRALSKVGLLDENVFLMSEEHILTEKFRKAGLVSFVVPESSIIHNFNSTTKHEPSKFMTKVTRQSCNYYMKTYRHWNWFQRSFLMYDPMLIRWALSLRRKLREMLDRNHK